jgi:membrane-associated phospholipid phosphatase
VPLPLAGLALLAAGVAYLAGGRPGRGGRVVLVAAIATLVARAVCDELKIAFGRTWPETWVENNPSWIRDHTWLFHPFHGGRGYASFPSGHTTDIAAPAAVLWRCVPRWRWVAVVPVVLVAGGLVASDFHYVSDVLAGLYLGVVVAYGVSALIAT